MIAPTIAGIHAKPSGLGIELRAGDRAPWVEGLPDLHKALGSIPGTTKKRKEKISFSGPEKPLFFKMHPFIHSFIQQRGKSHRRLQGKGRVYLPSLDWVTVGDRW